MTKVFKVKENSTLMDRLHQLEDLADKLKLRILFAGNVILIDGETNKEYDFLDLESDDCARYSNPQFITSFPSGVEYKLEREER